MTSPKKRHRFKMKNKKAETKTKSLIANIQSNVVNILAVMYSYLYSYLNLCILGNEAKEMMDDNN